MKNYFDEIYQVAINQDEVHLKKLLMECVRIDVYQRGSRYLSVAAACARDGNFEAAEWLRHHGAFIDHIACGAASGGHRDYAEKLRTQHNATACLIALGAAFGGYQSYAEYLRKSHNAKVSMIALGAAMGGYIEYAEFLRINYDAEVYEIAAGAAMGGYTQYLDTLIMKYLRVKENVNYISIQLASKGDIESVKDFYSKYKKYGLQVNSIALGAGNSGDMQYAESIRQLYKANAYDIVCGAWGARHLMTEESLYYFFLTLPVQVQKIYAEALRRISSITKVPCLVDLIMKKTIHVQGVAKKYQINHKLAEYLTRDNNFLLYATWCLQVIPSIQLRENRSLPFEIILLVSQYITELSVRSTQELILMFDLVRFQIKKQMLLNTLLPFTKTKKRHYFMASSDLREQVMQFVQDIDGMVDDESLSEWLHATLQSLQQEITKHNTSKNKKKQRKKELIYTILSKYVDSTQYGSSQTSTIRKINNG